MSHGQRRIGTGAVAWMTQNPVAANLLLVLIFLGGLINARRVKTEVFPEFALDIVNIVVPYPGASPAEVEQGITLAIEEAVRGVDGVKKVRSNAAEGAGTVSVELLLGANPDKVLQDIKNEVDRVRTLPEEAEDPQVTLATRRQRVITLVLAGETDRRTLHDLAEHARDELIARGAATQVDVQGLPPLEIAVEVDRETLAAYGLSLQDVATQITLGSLELPAGAVDTRGGEVLVRVSDRRLDGETLGELVLRGGRGGAEVRLADVARITDGFAEDDQFTYFDGKPAVLVQAYRVGSETPDGIATGVKAYADELAASLPAGLSVTTWDDDSELLRARIDLLLRNSQTGLILVFVVLALFLDLRLAFWVAMGIPTSILGAFILFPSFGVSINMISLFALLLTLGIVVDDAIVVAENAWEKRERGIDKVAAAVEGTQQMLVPVAFSVATTVVAFVPLLLVPGVSGKIFGVIPIVVISVLTLSLLESFFILPAHLAEMSTSTSGPLGWLYRAAAVPRDFVTRQLQAVIDGPYDRLLRFVLSWRYVTAAAAFAAFVAAQSWVGAGLIPFTFLPKIESDTVRASARLPYGVPLEMSDAVREALERSLDAAIAEVGAESAVRGRLSSVGLGPASFGPGAGPRTTGSHLVSLEVDLLPGDQRTISARDLEAAWERLTPQLPGVESLTFAADLGASGGAAVDVQISHPDNAVLAKASEEVAQHLRGYGELKNIDNTFAAGKVQLDFKLKPEARTMGLTSADVARQLRNAFFGAEAIREQRGREELKIMVRLPAEQRLSEYDLEQLDIRTPTGGYVPLRAVADFERGQAATNIQREDGRRVVDVKAELAAGAPSSRPVLEALAKEGGFLEQLRQRYPGLRTRFAGEQESQNESLANLGQNFALALAAVFVLLAVPFRSYFQPIIVMVSIPMGFVGAVGGHLLHGYGLSVISLMGIIAASGVVVNDSLVLIEAANTFRDEEGLSHLDAIIAAGKRRMRPILLTSFTTYAGLISMIFETSTQARFLVPMALSLGYGVLFCTAIALLLVPAVYMIEWDIESRLRRFVTWLYPPDPDEPHTALDDEDTVGAQRAQG